MPTLGLHRSGVALGITLVLSAALLAQQADRARTEALARRVSDRLQVLQREADRLASEEQTLLGELRKLEVQRQIRAEELRDADAQVQEASAEIDKATGQMHRLEERDL